MKDEKPATPISGVVRVGERFTFVTVAGRRIEYEVESVEGEAIEQTMAMMARLRNLEGGGFAQVTLKWLTDGELPGRAHWLRAAAQEEREAA